ncbi:exodeoxyribonuclease V subunit gamma [Pseudoalteromonas tunicata]|uniref:RecBCD enzyme subunit RecC n=1 Tax=Pseudoalteromonas tunicata D2 TaxID=87626 RepID=A4CBT1_9GAMM|nr:exodeoxyribonuclease V subunit gamma [Pseudoalteromonas tunicata]ATC94373.1 exodeoxyribonuclease V gamma subunit [Pseudoalteromonas tunicata]AXT30112.1 exodeoxyribonuclease V subunit gamma [Pseudoalteromonas tunicata]EAR27818.1 exonuclease V, gamma chain with recB and recD: 5' and 3' nuclease, ATPase, recombinase, helicase [Pseudoalteromonas tunicata D2]
MLHIIQSNRLEVLQQQLHLKLLQYPLNSLFKKEIILVQSPGMSQWLKMGLAHAQGIVAQVDFPLPSSFTWRLYQSLLPDVPAESAFNKANLTWKLFAILPTCLNEPLFLPLERYLSDDNAGQKLFSLCEKIADVYDQYLMYRPTWLATWQTGKDTLPDVDISHAPWQPELWRKLVAYSQSLGQSQYHRANMQDALLEALANAPLNLLPERISIFGISALANSQLVVLHALAERIPVYLYFFNPSEHYWGDVVDEKTLAKINAKYQIKPNLAAQEQDYYFVGNPLLSSWGKLGRDYFEQLIQLNAQWHDYFVEPEPDNLLSAMQSEIYHLAFKGQSLPDDPTWYVTDQGKIAVNPQDCSIQFANCHTALREVEALHDHLLDLFSQDPSLTPKDIIVMMPDVGSYSPYIEAVFGAASAERYIPYALADLAIAQEKPILSSFNQLVNLPFSRFGVSEILDLLQVDCIARHFNISHNDLDQIRFWLEQVGVKWGLNASHKAQLAQPQLALNTWQHGLERLLLGVVQRDENNAFSGIYAADEVEGMAAALLGHLLAFVNRLAHYKTILEPDATLAVKAQLLHQLVQDFYDHSDEQAWDLLTLDSLIQNLGKHYDNKDYQGEVSARIISALVQQGLSENGVGQRFLVGQVNFCTLMPMRAVPFKVVCMLGLNDADYPRSVQPMGFDLLPHSKRQKGDRSRKLDDRYLFLEAMLSVRHHLYISYIGRSCFDNSERVPSVLVSELLEYLGRSFYQPNCADFPNNLIKKHHLQPFNPDYYQPGAPQSYHPTWQIKPLQLNQDKAALPLLPAAEIELNSFIRTVCQAQESFYRNSLGLKLTQFDEIAKDEEPFSLDHLERYFYLDEMLVAALKGTTINQAQILQRGDLPLAHVGEITLEQMQQRIGQMVNSLHSHDVTEFNEPIEINVQLGQSQLVGWLTQVTGKKQVFYRTATIKAKDMIKAYLYHLVGSLGAHITETWVVGLDGQYQFKVQSAQDAKSQLDNWFRLYQASLQQPVAFFPTAAWQFATTGDFAKAAQKFAGGEYIGRGEAENPYVALDFKRLEPHEAEFIRWSELLVSPIAAHAVEVKHAGA